MIKKLTAVGIAVGVTLAAAGCGGGTAQQADDYCVDQAGNIVDYDYCDDGDGTYLFWHDSGHHKYKPGKRVPSSVFYKGKTTKPSVSKSHSSPAKPQTSSKVGSSSKSSGSKSGGSSSRSGKR